MQRVPRYDPYARPPQQHAVPHGAAGHQREAEHSNPLSYAQPGVATSTPYEASYEPGGPSRFGGGGGGGRGFVRGSGGHGGSREREWERDRHRERGSRERDGVAAASSSGSGGAAPPEQQSRTLFVRNVSYNTSERTLMDLFKKYGEVKRVFNLIDKRGMAFITYYDIRDAQEAKRDLQGYDFEGRPLDIHYSIPRDDEDQAKNEENNSTVFARLRGGTGPLRDKPPMTNREVKRLFEEWGSVKEVRECRGKPFQKFVEFYDIRHSEKCLKEAAETHKSTILDVQPAHAKREGRRDDDRDRDRPRTTGWGGGGGGYSSGGGGGGYDDRSRPPGDDYRFAGGRTGGPGPYSGSVSPYGGYGAATPSASTLPAYAHTSSYIPPQPSHQPYNNPAQSTAALAHQDASQGAAGGDVGATLQTLLSLVQLFNQPQPQPASAAPAQGYAPPQHAPQATQASYYHLQALASPYSQQPQQQQQPPGATSYYQPQPTGAPAALAQGYAPSSSSAAPQYQQQQQQQRYGM